MSDEQQDNKNNIPWGVAGPKTAEHRALAKQWFVDGLVRFHAVSQACEYAGINRTTAYKWREQDKKFSEAWDQSIARLHDIARASIFQRGILGWDERVCTNGQPVYEYELLLDKQGEPMLDEKSKPIYKRGEPVTIHKWSDSLAALYAKANLPEYKEKQQIDLKVQMAEQDARDKEGLLADLAAAIANEDKTSVS